MKAVLVKTKDKDIILITTSVSSAVKYVEDTGVTPESAELVEGEVVIDLKADNSPEEFVSWACNTLKVQIQDLKGHNRARRLVRIRTALSFILKEVFNLSLNEIGDVLNRNHASILNLVGNIESDEGAKNIVTKLGYSYDYKSSAVKKEKAIREAFTAAESVNGILSIGQ